MTLSFEWDDEKAVSNLRKHSISFEYAARVFWDNSRFDESDDRQDYGEERRVTVGHVDERLLVVTYTERGEQLIRLISARKATRHEQKNHHDHLST